MTSKRLRVTEGVLRMTERVWDCSRLSARKLRQARLRAGRLS